MRAGWLHGFRGVSGFDLPCRQAFDTVGQEFKRERTFYFSQ
jgi:hypothetical protein